MGPFSDDATLVWLLLGLLSLIGVLLVRLSKQQPFPEPSSRYGWTILTLAALLALGTAAPAHSAWTVCWPCCASWVPSASLQA